MSATLSLSLSQLRPFACSLGCSIVHWTVDLDSVHNFAMFCCRSLALINCHHNLHMRFFALAVTDSISLFVHFDNTAILYRASTGPEQGFPCEVFHTGKSLFSLQGTPDLIAGTPVFITAISL
jgi:hypothetical protein